MTLVFAAAGGAAYAAVLWRIAVSVARRRAIALGSFPVWVGMACAGAAVAATAAGSASIAVAAGLIGAVVCGLVDARTGLIFDALSLTVTGAGLAGARFAQRLADGLLGALAVGAALAAIYLITARRGIGLGDVKLGSAVALGYGLHAGFVALGSAFVLGAAYAGVLLGTGRARRTDALRFGPFIAGGAAVGLTTTALGWF
jgi:leader peptidase (prepilin peptidase)/N-methyltransferase